MHFEGRSKVLDHIATTLFGNDWCIALPMDAVDSVSSSTIQSADAWRNEMLLSAPARPGIPSAYYDNEQEDNAARVIQHVWRKKNVMTSSRTKIRACHV